MPTPCRPYSNGHNVALSHTSVAYISWFVCTLPWHLLGPPCEGVCDCKPAGYDVSDPIAPDSTGTDFTTAFCRSGTYANAISIYRTPYYTASLPFWCVVAFKGG